VKTYRLRTENIFGGIQCGGIPYNLEAYCWKNVGGTNFCVVIFVEFMAIIIFVLASSYRI